LFMWGPPCEWNESQISPSEDHLSVVGGISLGT
jgi:hypothetical protein